jgi:hypothetical protein
MSEKPEIKTLKVKKTPSYREETYTYSKSSNGFVIRICHKWLGGIITVSYEKREDSRY